MDYNVDRLAILSGVIDRDEYTDKLLLEDHRDIRRSRRRLDEMEATVVLSPETPEELAAVGALDLDPETVELEPTPEAQSASGGAEAAPAEEPPMDVDAGAPAAEEELPPPEAEMPPVEDMEEELEERLRRAIRHEVQAVLAEVMAQEEDQQIERGRKMKNVGVSMGFAGVGFKSSRPSRSKNRATSQGAGGTRGFGGPGFW